MLSTSVFAAAPAVDSIYPAGGQRGTTVAVTAAGKLEPWPVKGWASAPGVTIEAGKKAGELKVTIAKDAAVGPHLIRLYNADGASGVRCFVVGDQAEAVEAEPNDELAKPQLVAALPVTVNGQLEKSGDVDFYAVKLEAAQTLVASVQGRRLGSAIDPMLHVYAPGGGQVGFVHDVFGMDPVVAHKAERAGTYVVRVSAQPFPPAADVKLAGGKDAAYRLHLTTGAFVRGVYPLGVRRGEKTTVRPLGWNLSASDAIEVDATNVPAGVDHLFVPVAGGEGRVRVEVGDGAEWAQSPAKATPATGPATRPIDAGGAASGVIATPGEEDVYEFTAKGAKRVQFDIRAAGANSPLEAVLTVRDKAGKQMTSTATSGTPGDPRTDWLPDVGGTYRLAVSDLFHRGGPDFTYRLRFRQPTPEVVATVENDAYAVVPGKAALVKVKVERKNGHAEKLTLAAKGLPAGVTAAEVAVPEKGGDVTVELKAAEGAKAASGAVRFVLKAGDKEVGVAGVDLTKEVEKAGGQGYVDRLADVWVTVGAGASVAPAKAK